MTGHTATPYKAVYHGTRCACGQFDTGPCLSRRQATQLHAAHVAAEHPVLWEDLAIAHVTGRYGQ